MQKLKLALLPQHFCWSGGLEFIRHILNGLATVAAIHNWQVHIAVEKEFINDDMYVQLQDYLAGTSIITGQIFYSAKNNDLADVLKVNNIDIVLPVNSDLGADFPVPWLAYIPDFQHKYLHSYFTEHECFVRETAFSARLRDCKAVVVNSHEVKSDILKFYPWINGERVKVLPFTPHPMTAWLEVNPFAIREKYGLPQDYFLICNQFWIHKDHPTAFHAFAMLENKSLHLVCTGTLSDYRYPNYINELKDLLSNLGISDRVHFLGHIPKLEQIGLLKGSVALVQPTLFEGGPGGGATYDAVALSIPVLLSDIDVNKEVIGTDIYHFHRKDAGDLSKCMQRLLLKIRRVPADDALLSEGLIRQQQLGSALHDAINYTLDCYGVLD
ncbi:glycosyltransferase [Aeromonas bestiarum]|uniref:glycosyltransferase n=1 Tax=Aeromonas bestiarum TaxID=105751 RepID=UPI000689F4D4|nr:glycosyltransferase [Aeromonas bestiarum]